MGDCPMTEWNERKPIHLVCAAFLCAILTGAAFAAGAIFGGFNPLQMKAFALFCVADGVVAFPFTFGMREYEPKDGKSLVVRNSNGLLLDWGARCVICKPIPFSPGLRVEQI